MANIMEQFLNTSESFLRTPVDAAPLPCVSTRTIAPLKLRSDELLRGRKTVEINHQGVVYRLQSTKLGKLILTK